MILLVTSSRVNSECSPLAVCDLVRAAVTEPDGLTVFPLENHPRLPERVGAARECLRVGQGTKLEGTPGQITARGLPRS
jgi:hypothetical protein